ncbi:gametoproteintin-binding protein 1 [Sigmodon hispidus]
MAAQVRTPRSRSRTRILGCSSVLRFLRSLVGRKASSNKSLAKSQPGPSQQQDVVPSRMGRQGGRGRREPQLHAMVPRVFSAAPSTLPLHDPFGLGTGDMGSQTLTSKDTLKLKAQGVEATSVSTREIREVLGHLPEKKGEEEEPAGEASGASGASVREHLAQALEAEQGCLQWVPGPLALTPGAFVREEEEGRCLIEIGDLRLTSCKVGSTPWNYLLGLYKQLQKSAMTKTQRPSVPQFPLKDGLSHEGKGEQEGAEEEEDSYPDVCAPRIATFQCPLQKTFRSTDTVGFVESELKRILAVRRESRLWKVGSPEGRELLTRPDITLEEAGMVDGQHLLLEEMDEMGNWPPPE